MKKTALLSALLAISSITFAAQLPHPNSISAAHSAGFTDIDSIGNINITIKPAAIASHTAFSIDEPKTEKNRIYARVRNHTLYLRQAGAQDTPMSVTVYMHQLNHLNVFGTGSVTATNLKSKALTINTNTTGKIKLNGMMALSNLYVSGKSNVTLKWVTGNDLAIYGQNHSHITIAGNINCIRANLRGHSILNAKYLRAKTVWIKTAGQAQAQVLAINSIQAYPQDKSNIYYYKSPKLMNNVYKASGNTLQLAWNN